MCSLCSQLGNPSENSQRPQVHFRPSQRFYRAAALIVSQSLEVLIICTSHFTSRDFTGHTHISSQAHLILLAWHSLSCLLFFRSKFPGFLPSCDSWATAGGLVLGERLCVLTFHPVLIRLVPKDISPRRNVSLNVINIGYFWLTLTLA